MRSWDRYHILYCSQAPTLPSTGAVTFCRGTGWYGSSTPSQSVAEDTVSDWELSGAARVESGTFKMAPDQGAALGNSLVDSELLIVRGHEDDWHVESGA
jgi:hypothetical protein